MTALFLTGILTGMGLDAPCIIEAFSISGWAVIVVKG
jgi:hypothetical protein